MMSDRHCRLEGGERQHAPTTKAMRRLAKRANVSYGTLKHFEKTGDASMEFLIAIAFALNAEGEFDNLFPPVPYKTIEDVIEKAPRQRGRRK